VPTELNPWSTWIFFQSDENINNPVLFFSIPKIHPHPLKSEPQHVILQMKDIFPRTNVDVSCSLQKHPGMKFCT
jgi:hypothetical protein